MTRIAVLSLLVLAAADPALHKQWMNDASDAQEDYREAVAAKSSVQAAAAATRIAELMATTSAYWAERQSADGVRGADQSRALAKAVATLAGAGKLDAAAAVFTRLGASCNTCHELHLEKR